MLLNIKRCAMRIQVPSSLWKVVATARTGKETDTFHISGHFLFYLQQKIEQRENYILKCITCPQKHTIQTVVIPKSEIVAGSVGLWPGWQQSIWSVLFSLPLWAKKALQLTASRTQISTESSILIGECNSTMKPTIHVHVLPRLWVCGASPFSPLYTKWITPLL